MTTTTGEPAAWESDLIGVKLCRAATIDEAVNARDDGELSRGRLIETIGRLTSKLDKERKRADTLRAMVDTVRGERDDFRTRLDDVTSQLELTLESLEIAEAETQLLAARLKASERARVNANR